MNRFFASVRRKNSSATGPAQYSAGIERCWNVDASGWAEGPTQLIGARAPLFDREAGVVLIGDVRLNNTDELKQALPLRIDTVPLCDEELVLAAHRQWGDDAPKYLLGDYSYVLWHMGAGRLTAVRDHMGIKCLYRVINDDGVFISNEIATLRAAGVDCGSVSEASVGRYLRCGELYGSKMTFHKQLEKLPPASLFSWSEPGGLECQRYWRIEDCADSNGVEPAPTGFGDLLQTVVHSHCEGQSSIGAHLSGGLDSSAIVGAAAASGYRLEGTYNWMPPPSTQESGDPQWSMGRTMAEVAGYAHHYTDFAENEMLALLTGLDISLGDSSTIWYEHQVRQAAKSGGVDVLLSGWGGDQFISNPGREAYADLFWHGSPSVVLHDASERVGNGQESVLRVLRSVVSQLFFQPLKYWYHRYLATPLIVKLDLLDCCHPEFRDFARQLELPAADTSPLSLGSAQFRDYRQGHLHSRIEGWAACGLASGIEYRYPLLDKRIVEYALRVGPEFFYNRGVRRHGVKSAAQAWVPPQVLAANLKYEPDRVSRLHRLQISALEAWRVRNEDVTAQHAFIDRRALIGLIGKLSRNDFADPLLRLQALRTATQSILVLNMGVGSLRPLG